MLKNVKASDISDKEILREVYLACIKRDMWANTSLIAESFPDFPFKVVAAKLAKVLKRELVTGCDCGCRGDWELTKRGYDLIGVEPWRDNPCEGIYESWSIQ